MNRILSGILITPLISLCAYAASDTPTSDSWMSNSVTESSSVTISSIDHKSTVRYDMLKSLCEPYMINFKLDESVFKATDSKTVLIVNDQKVKFNSLFASSFGVTPSTDKGRDYLISQFKTSNTVSVLVPGNNKPIVFTANGFTKMMNTQISACKQHESDLEDAI